MLRTKRLLQEGQQYRDDDTALQTFSEADEEYCSQCQYEPRYSRLCLSVSRGKGLVSIPGTAKTFGISTVQLRLPVLCSKDDQIRRGKLREGISNLMSEETQKDIRRHQSLHLPRAVLLEATGAESHQLRLPLPHLQQICSKFEFSLKL